ncbi:MAG: hypothetical protein HY788_22905 [Deltaproteobacteria bacterium]|nr:hypothetical protein [Deltaproteobacteria bacterium]
MQRGQVNFFGPEAFSGTRINPVWPHLGQTILVDSLISSNHSFKAPAQDFLHGTKSTPEIVQRYLGRFKVTIYTRKELLRFLEYEPALMYAEES